jgi:hypothetical protein
MGQTGVPKPNVHFQVKSLKKELEGVQEIMIGGQTN